ncbi:MAG: tetratricopeptide repeat protein [Bacteroidia bacterium]|nr:tetratricopeptide repeat protein [Bacteroidia bacterium]
MYRYRLFLLAITLLHLSGGGAFAQLSDEVNTLRLAQTYEQGGKHEEALRYYQRLLAERPSNSAYFDGVRRTLTTLKRYDEALSALNDRLRVFPNEEQLYVHRGGLYMLRDRKDSARADWDKAISINPKNSQVYSLIADHCLNARLYDEAVNYLRSGRKALNAPQLFTFEIARACAMNMNIDCSMDEYLQYLRTVPQALYQIQQHISMFSDIPDAFETAVRRCRAAVKEHSGDITLRFLLSWMYQERKDYAMALDVIKDIDKLNNAGGMEILRFAGRAYDDGAFRVAADAYKHITEEYRNANFLPQVDYQYARCIEALQEQAALPEDLLPASGTRYPSTEAVASYQGAIALYEEVARKWAGQPVASESLYRIGYIKFRHFGDNDGALEILRGISAARRTVFGKADADVLIGDILIAKGDLDGALTQYTSVLQSPQLERSSRNSVWFKIAEVHFFKGEFDTALVELGPLTEDVQVDIANDALELSALMQQYRMPGEVPLQRFARARLAERQNKFAEAEALLADIIEQYSSNDIVDLAYLERAEVLGTMQRFDDAAAMYRDFLAKRDESFLRDRGLYLLAEITELRLNDTATALTLYQQLLDAHPYSQFAPQARAHIVRLRKGNS